MKIFLRPHPSKPHSAQCAARIMAELLRLGLTPMLDHQTARHIPPDPGCLTGTTKELAARCDIVMPIGGDGTLMRCAHLAVEAGKPILGVNTGRVGFLTQLEACELDGLALLRDGSYTTTDRMLLEGAVEGPGGPSRFIALNDIVLSRTGTDGIADVEVHQGDRLITRQRGDGMIFATPTGSTAYSLSAGGPIADPEVELILLTAICPHATFRCSMVLPPARTYTARQHGDGPGGLHVVADGRRVAEIGPEDAVTVRKHRDSVAFIHLGRHDFYDSLSEKLSWRR